jgi:gluconokinase
MGVAGVGKTTVGRALADALSFAFVDADDFHSAANVEKMRRGEALTEADRAPWLAALKVRLARGDDLVLACSALRSEYRKALSPATFVLLDAPDDVIAARLATREAHFAGPSLLESQRRALEGLKPGDGLTVNATKPVEEIIRDIRSALP